MADERRDDGGSGDAVADDEDFKLRWGRADSRWDEAAAEREVKASDLPWDEMAEDDAPAFLLDDPAEPDLDDDESPPHGDPLEQAVEGESAFAEPPGPGPGAGTGAGPGTGAGAGARMGNLQDALASIRERVQSLSSDMPGPGRQGAAATSQLALYRAATDDRTLSELRRHGTETENLLRRLAANLQDLSTDLRSIVDAARRAIDQTSEQAESSIELGRLLGRRLEQMDGAVGGMQVHLDQRLTKLEQRAGVGVVREELAELRNDLNDMRNELAAVTDGGGSDLSSRIDVVGAQLDNTVGMLRDLIEGPPGQEGELGDMVDGVVASIRTETEAAVEPFRAEVEELGRQLGEALDREEQLGSTLSELTEEVSRLRKRIAVRATPPTIDDDQIQHIVDAVVAATSAKRTTAAKKAAPRRRPARQPEPDFEDDLDVEPEPEEEAPKRPLRARPVRAARKTKKAPAPEPEDDEPDYEVDINEPFEPHELDLADAALDVEPDEEPIRRARGTRTTKRADRPLKGRRSRSSK